MFDEIELAAFVAAFWPLPNSAFTKWPFQGLIGVQEP